MDNAGHDTHRFAVVDDLGARVDLYVEAERDLTGPTGFIAHTLASGQGFAIHVDDLERYLRALEQCGADIATPIQPPARWRATT